MLRAIAGAPRSNENVVLAARPRTPHQRPSQIDAARQSTQKILAHDDQPGNHHHAATATRHPDCRKNSIRIVAL
jgi:hypothetical protein